MKSKFPTFEEIDRGYCVFADTYFRKLDNEGEPIFGERLALDVVISHNRYFPLIKSVKIMRNRNKTKRLYFKVKMYDGNTYTFPYSEEGWNAAILRIKDEMREIRQMAENILNEC